MSTDTDVEGPEDILPRETAEEKLIHNVAKLRADTKRLNRLTSTNDVPAEIAAQLGFMSSDADTLARQVASYIDGDPLPDVCPVCGDRTTQPDEDLEADETYDVEKLCVLETSSLGAHQSIIHYSDGGRSEGSQ